MFNLKRITIEHILTLAAFLLGLCLRFVQLGSAPLSDGEALWANQALQFAHSDPDLLVKTEPAYVLLTGLTFSLFGVSDFLARFWPALAGSLLILAPCLLATRLPRTDIVRISLLILSFGLAIDPGLVTAARLASGTMMAVSFFCLATAAAYSGWWLLSGISSGITLLSGPDCNSRHPGSGHSCQRCNSISSQKYGTGN